MISAAAISSGKILIVDDQPANVQLLELMLQRAGYLRVTSTMDPTAVVGLYREHDYDLILLDLRMPGMDGFEVMAALKKERLDDYVPILVITAQPGDKLQALKAGAKDFVTKPFEQAEVLTRIHNMLEVRLLHAQEMTYSRQLEERVQERTAELGRSEEMFRELASNIPAAMWIRDMESETIQFVNPAWKKLSGLSAGPGDPLESAYQVVHPDDLKWVTHERRQAGSTHSSHEYRLVRPDLGVRWVHARTFPIANPSGKAPWIVEIIEDVTQRREAQRQLLHLARHDALTDLPNRALLYEALRDALFRAQDEESGVSVLLLDIDYFKTINDTQGHTAGDALLREFAARLATCVRPGDTVGRLGGDEFAIVMPTHSSTRGTVEVANRIRNVLKQPLVVEGRAISITVSIGIASYPIDTTELDTLIRCADAAMYDAKASGRNTFRSYSPEMHARALSKTNIEGALRVALERNEFVLHYQPKMDIESGKWTGVEALIRWNRPGAGMVPPDMFIPALEEIGLIIPVGLWVIDTACRQIGEWERSGLGPIRIAVNVSSRQIREEYFVLHVAETIRKHRVDARLLEFEITESTLMAHGEVTDAALRKLKDLGIAISIDDFGTGYSNLAYLKRFRVDALKIDIAFIRDVITNLNDANIAVAIINIAHSLELKVVAEGVETRDQLEFLRIHGCDEVQGYLLSKPLPVDEITAKLREPAFKPLGQRARPRGAKLRVARA